MTRGLCEILEQVKALTGRDRVSVLPPPYKKGHFRVQGEAVFPESCGFAGSFDGRCTSITVQPEVLLRALERMSAKELPKIEPSLSPLHTLLYQIFSHFPEGVSADEPELLRYALDLEEPSPRARVVFDALCRELPGSFAAALREGGQKSCLPLIAERIINTKWVI